jgi:hypothetical protein
MEPLPRYTAQTSLLFALLAAFAAAVLLGCRGRASPEDCKEMKDHYLDLSVKETPGAAAMSSAQAAAVRDVERGLKRAEPSYRAVDDRCADVTRSEVSCATGAKTTKDWEACVHLPDAR